MAKGADMRRGYQRGYADYAPLTARRRRLPRLFRTAELNVAGWSALVGTCLLAGGVGNALGSRAGIGMWVAAPAAVIPLAIALVVDRRRWARITQRQSPWSE